MHGRDVAWQSAFSRAHPEYAVVDRRGRQRQWGVLSLAYPEVRRHFTQRILDAITPTAFDGLFVCLRSQSKPARRGDQYGFNDPACQAFRRRHGADPRSEPFDTSAWRRHLGGYLTTFIRELRAALQNRGYGLAAGGPRGDILGPPIGNTELQWRRWMRHDLVDELIINQNSSRCPSMWHQLWPMHQGTGYVRSYLDGSGLDSLDRQLVDDYAPAVRSSRARVYVARQWDTRSPDREAALAALPGVAGLVFSSFRFDNPQAVARNDWRA